MTDQPTEASPTQPNWAEMPVHRPLDPTDPREMGGYRLRARLGEGGMGRVYLSYTPGGRPVAIKIVRDEYAGDPSFRRRFELEVATAQRVQGIFTAPVIDANPQAQQPWLATAYVPGPSLQNAVGAYGPLPPESVLVLVAGVAEALQSIHGAGVVHRDLKPSNVILAADGPRVIDFGIARAVDSTSVTQTNMRVGTPAFMAPEQVRGQEVTPAIDVFALGSLACYAATGELPFGGGLDPAVPYRILEQEPDLATCPDGLRGLITRCLTKDPQQRPAPAEVIELCRQLSTGTRLQMGQGWLPPSVAAAVNRIATAPVPAAPPTDPGQPPRRGRRRLVLSLSIAGVVVVLAAAGVIAAALGGAFRTPGTAEAGGPAGVTTTTNPPTQAAAANNNQTTDTPSDTPADTSGPANPSESAGASSPSVQPGGSRPGTSLGQFGPVDVPYNYGVSFSAPTKVVPNSAAPDLAYDGGLYPQNNAKAIIIQPGEAATYQNCATDTRYVTNGSALGQLPAGGQFCELLPGRTVLVTIDKIPDQASASQFYEFTFTIWLGPGYQG